VTAPILLLAAALQSPATAQADVPAGLDAQICASMRKYEERYRSELPQMADAVTRLDSFSVDCGSRLLTWHRTLIGDPANLRAGWQDRHQADWDADVCGSETFRSIVAAGWRFVDRYAIQDGREPAFEARCG